MFLRNFWYLAAWSETVTRQPKGYIFLNEPVVMYRKRDATPVALEDRCAHRRLFLSRGKLSEDTIVCDYHGLAYDPTGACVNIPGQEHIPSWARVKSYPVVERHGCIWLWPGDPALADADQIPDLHWATNPGWGAKDRVKINCYYQLVLDNLSDLSHVGYLHASNVGTAALAQHGKVETHVNGDHVTVSRWTMDKPAPPTYRDTGGFTTNIDRWQIATFSPPSYFSIQFGAAAAGSGALDGLQRRDRWSFQACHFATPITDKTSYYFWAIAHDFGEDRDPATAALYFPEMYGILAQDIGAFEAQQECIDLDPSKPTGHISADGGLVGTRRILERLYNQEQNNRSETDHMVTV
jgi:phenylpropionate dioxygenase-like ring-hydroxylating dioxygenase large terminal subunit